MKKLLIAGTSLIALTSASMAADMPSDAPVPSVAVANAWDAFVAVSAGYTSFDNDDFGFGVGGDLDDFSAEIRASAAYNFSNGFGIQSDVVFNHQALDLETDPLVPDFGDISVSNTDIAGHLFYRNDSYLLGVFGQYGVTSMDGLPIDFDRFYAGAEAQGYYGNFTLYAQGGWQGMDVGPFADEDPDGFFINAELRYFATPNLKFAVNGGYDQLSVGDDDLDVDTFKVGGSAEYKFDENPLSLFANVNYTNSQVDDFDVEVSDVRVMAGLKLNLGTQTLIDRDRSGATLDPVKASALPNISAFAD